MKQIIDDPTTDTSIFEMVLMKYPRQLRRYVETIDRYMHSSDWVGMKNARRESMKQPKFLPKYDEPSRFAPVSDTSKTPSYQDYDMQEFPDEENTVTPKRKFTNFLRRAKPKYDPSSKLRDRRATTSDIPIEVIQRKQWEQTPVIPEVIEPSAPDSPPNINIIEPPEDKRQTTPKPFLRRKSQAVVPAKVKWNAKSRTDCWSEQKSTTTEQKLTHSISANQIKNKRARRSSTPTPKETVPEELDRSWSESRPKTSKPKKLEPKTKKKVPAKVDSRSVTPNPSMPNKAPPEEPVYAEPEEQLPTEGNVLKTEMLETIFNVLNADHIPVIEYLASRSNTDSAIPQFHGRSFFVTHFTEDIYADTLEALENHYNYLCSEDAC